MIVSWWAMTTSSPRTIAPIVVPSGRVISSMRLPATGESPLSLWTIASIASAAPRRSECTRTTSPRRTCASRAPIVTVCGEIAMSMVPPSMSSA